MQVKIFEADDMRSALEKVKKALGPQALILSTRNVLKKNRLGLPGKTVIEVTAAVDGDLEFGSKESTPSGSSFYNRRGAFETVLEENAPEASAEASVKVAPMASAAAASAAASGNGAGDAREPGAAEKSRKMSGRKIGGGSRAHSGPANSSRKAAEKGSDEKTPGAFVAREPDLAREIREMRESFAALSRQFSQVRGEWMKYWLDAFAGNGGGGAGFSGSGNDVLLRLHRAGLDGSVLQAFREAVAEMPEHEAFDDPDALASLLESFIARGMKTNDPLVTPEGTQRRIAFVGPTGVGKTTTLAKVAANFMLNHSANIALATIDNYRIAAAEQLKVYGRIMNVPVEVARTPEQLRKILARHDDKDLVLIDTAGRSPKDDMSLHELAGFLGSLPAVENHLVLSAATRQEDLFSTIGRFGEMALHGIVFTKTDECDTCGQILNVGLSAGYPLSMLTNGQRVPEDYIPPDPRRIAELILTNNEVPEQWNSTEDKETRRERFVH